VINLCDTGLEERLAHRLTSLGRLMLDGSAPDAAEVARSSIELLSTLLPEEVLLDFCLPPTINPSTPEPAVDKWSAGGKTPRWGPVCGLVVGWFGPHGGTVHFQPAAAPPAISSPRESVSCWAMVWVGILRASMPKRAAEGPASHRRT